MKITVKQMLLEMAMQLHYRQGDAEVFVARARDYHNMSVFGGQYTDEADTALLRRLYNEGCEWRREVLIAKGPR